ncbi:lytic transglycosylase domain-containing protein [Roseococcus sp.]|uniref:lytic transglycosylase domain-containing protein n=1 Tax=Roseococcus sp. TaxID=2109646 RepID=UPI003BAB0EC1
MRIALPLLVLLAALNPETGRAQASAGPDPTLQCRAAIAQAERGAGIPAGLLQAMGRVESGRRNPETGVAGPWPWTLNAEGRGQFFPTREAAIAAVRELQGRGVRVIDVGCMQVNLHFHPRAFANLEEAFDPAANARYAARFLGELQAARGDWMVAAGHYHSQTPDLAQAYRARVQAALPAEQARAGQDLALRPSPPMALSLSNRAERAAVLPPAALGTPGRGRGLDAYRAAPIPLTGRQFALIPNALIRR